MTPDLACFGKAMANGYAISAVCGRSDVMKKAEKEVFISSTFFPNSLGYVAALKTIEILERELIHEGLVRTRWNKSLLARQLGISRSNLLAKVEKYGLDKPGSLEE